MFRRFDIVCVSEFVVICTRETKHADSLAELIYVFVLPVEDNGLTCKSTAFTEFCHSDTDDTRGVCETIRHRSYLYPLRFLDFPDGFTFFQFFSFFSFTGVTCDGKKVDRKKREDKEERREEMEIETNDERIISCHLQKYVDKVEAWRLKQRYEDYLDKFESEEDFEKYVQDRVRKKCLEARAKIERIVMNRTKKRAVTEREKSRVMTQKSSSSISFSPDGQFPYFPY